MATTSLDTLRTAVLANDQLNGRRMLELARDKEGALTLAQMCDGYADMRGREKIKMIVTASIILKLFLEQHRTRERNAANSRKRKAEEEPVAEDKPDPEDDEPQPEPPLPATAGPSSPISVADPIEHL